MSNYVKNTDAFSVIAGPAARIRPTSLPDQFFSCETPPPPPPPPHPLNPSPRVSDTDVAFACSSLLSRLRRPGQDPVGMRGIPIVTLVVFTNHSLGLTSRLPPSPPQPPPFSAEVQDPRPANETLPQRAPAQAAALRPQPAHREGPPLHEGGLAGRAVSTVSLLIGRAVAFFFQLPRKLFGCS